MLGGTIRMALAVGLILGSTGVVLARGGGGNGDSGSGLSPYAALSGNDRSAGLNNGNYRAPRLDPYLGTYGDGYARPVQDRDRPIRRPYYARPIDRDGGLYLFAGHQLGGVARVRAAQ